MIDKGGKTSLLLLHEVLVHQKLVLLHQHLLLLKVQRDLTAGRHRHADARLQRNGPWR